jgi:hypothetical protein
MIAVWGKWTSGDCGQGKKLYQQYPSMMVNIITSFLNICRSVPPKTSHLLLHKKLLNPSSLTFACPVLITVFLPSLVCAPGLSADAGFKIGKEEA